MSHIKLTKEISTFGDTETEKNRIYHHKTPILFGDVGLGKALGSNKIPFGKKTINTLLVTFMIIIKLSHYI